jgi:hypothetical protein
MRNQIGKLKTIRKLRAEQRQRDYQIARDELAAIKGEMDAMQQEAMATYNAMENAKATPPVGAMLTAVDIERRTQLAQQYARYLEILDQRLTEADARHRTQKNKVAEAFMTARAADKAVDQLNTIDERLATEEARVAEIQEELQSEIVGKPRWSM